MDHSLPGASIQEIFQARILEWVAMSSSRGSSWRRDQICILWIDWQFLYPELPGKLCLTMQSAVLMALGIASLVSDNVSLFLIYLLLFAVLILSIKIIRKSKWEMTTLVYSWKADGLCHKIWLVGHLCRHELWEESRRQCNFTGNIWAEIYKILGEGLLLTQMVAKIPDPCTLEMKLRVNQISMNDDVGTSVCATSLVCNPLMMPSLWSTSFGSL